MKINQAVILAGGVGSRLKEITNKTAKPLIKINKKPFISYLVDDLENANILKIIILAGYKGKDIKNMFSNKKNIKVIVEKKPLGTGGSIVTAKEYLDEYFLLLNGDSYFNLNLETKILNFKKKNSQIFITKNNNYKSNKLLSNLSLDKNKKVIASKYGLYMYSGVSILKKMDLQNFSQNVFISLEKQIFDNLIKRKKLEGEINNESFIDIGTKSNLILAKNNFNKILKKKCFFFDRDNTLIYDKGYTYKKCDLKWTPGAIEAIKFLKNRNFLVIIITNQSGIAKGYFTEKNVINFHNHMNLILRKNNTFIDDFFYCPYHENGIGKYKRKTNLRKPGNQMIKNSITKWNINKKKSFFVGDDLKDKQAAKKSNIKFFYTNNKDLLKLVKNILKKYEY